MSRKKRRILELTKEEELVFSLISKKPISRDELVKATGKEDRAVRMIIEGLILKDKPIVSLNKGYKIGSSYELEQYERKITEFYNTLGKKKYHIGKAKRQMMLEEEANEQEKIIHSI